MFHMDLSFLNFCTKDGKEESQLVTTIKVYW